MRQSGVMGTAGRQRKWRIAALALVLLAAAACSEEPPPEDAIPMGEEVASVASDLAVLRSEVDRRVAECMKAEGFTSFPKSSRTHFTSLATLLSIRILDISEEAAKARGYSGDTAPGGITTKEEYEFFERMSQAEHDAYSAVHVGTSMEQVSTMSGLVIGIPTGGCVGKANVEVYGSLEDFKEGEAIFADLQSLSGEVLGRVERGGEFRKALDRWSDCMAASGHRFKNPSEAREEALATRDASGKPSAREIELAVSDARCQSQASLQKTYAKQVLKAQSSVLDSKTRLFLAWDGLMARVAANGYAGISPESDALRR